ncbi:MAG: MATE family efflux transporter [Lachnospiraceae bacterium]|nr:MATE family efflux transporter [Lachnospiraceae bacterium]
MASKSQSDKIELFARTPVKKALLTMAVPTIISQLVNLIYNMVDAFFIGRTGNSYMIAATTVTLTLVMMNVALSNLFGIGGGSLMARLMGAGDVKEARRVSSFSVFGAIGIAIVYAALVGLFTDPLLTFLGASAQTIGFARSYTQIVIVLGCLPSVLSLALAHLLRNAGYSTQASIGLSGGGILNVFLDPLFMFVLLPAGMEVTGAAIATALSNLIACIYLLITYAKVGKDSALSLSPADARKIQKGSIGKLFAVGIPSALLTGLFDLANVCVNIIASSHNDLVLAGMGIVMKVERIPNAVNIGICQGMLPIVAFNYSARNHERMRETIRTGRTFGLIVSAISIVLLEVFADPVSRVFLSTSKGDASLALQTIAYAATFLRIRCIASPVQLINYHTSYCMQAMGQGKATMLHAFVRELIFYIPFMFLLDHFFGEIGLASALPVGEACGAVFALLLLRHVLKKTSKESQEKNG